MGGRGNISRRVFRLSTEFISIFVTACNFTLPENTFTENTDAYFQEAEHINKEEEQIKKHTAEKAVCALSFSDFWERYGFKKGSKAKAKAKFDRLSSKDVELINVTLGAYLNDTVTSDAGRDKNTAFRPMRRYPEFYLSGRVWEGYMDKIEERNGADISPEWDEPYQRYLTWVKEKYPNLLSLNKHLSKTQLVEFKTTYYVEGKSKMGHRMETDWMTEAHQTISASAEAQNKYPDVFTLHCEKVRQFVKQHTI